MTVASEISRLQTAKSNIKSSVASKWVTIPASAKLDEYSGYIDQIKHNDYSEWTLAYWLKATTGLSWYKNRWLDLCYSEITDDWVVSWIFPSYWWMGSSNCDYIDVKFLAKQPWCLPQWDSTSCRVLDNRSMCNWYWFYAHKTNKDCFIINRAYCYCTAWSWSNWAEKQYYYRLWIDFSVPCMSCLGASYRCCSAGSYWDKNCDANSPWDDYEFIWKSFDCLKACRWNKPAWILCTTLESQDDNRYVWGAVFR